MNKFLFTILALSFSFTSIANVETERAQKLKRFEYNKNFVEKKMKIKIWLKRYKKYAVALEGKGPSGKILQTNFTFFKSKVGGAAKKPLVIIAPPILDPTPLDYLIASIFARKGYHVAVVSMGEDIANEKRLVADIPFAFIRTTTRFRRVIDWAETQDYIDSENVGTYGMSLGAVFSGILAGVEERIKASLIMAGGGDMPSIFAESEQAIVKKYRNSRMKDNNIKTIGEFKSFVEERLTIDPLDFSYRIKKEQIFMIIAEKDEAVKTEGQWQLWNSYHQPEYLSFDSNHFGTIFESRKHHQGVFKFFKRRLHLKSEIID